MNRNQIFELALSIQEPWFIEKIDFSLEQKRLDIGINFRKGAKFMSGETGDEKEYGVYDTIDKKWRHLNFFEHECYLHCRTPRIDMGEGQVKLISPPWAGLNSGFTLLFEALVIQLCTQMPVNVVARMIGEHDDKIWRLLEKYVDSARAEENFSEVQVVGMDETSRRKGHDYITLFVDLKKKQTIFVTEGKGHETVEDFVEDLKEHQGDAKKIEEVSCDMSPAFIKGVEENFPSAEITFDKFHLLKVINEAVDKVRKEEVQSQPLLKKKKYIFLKNRKNLTPEQTIFLEEIEFSKLNLKSVRALQIRENFQAIYQAETFYDYKTLLNKWYFWATHSKLEPMIQAAKTIKNHWDGVLRWKISQINNGILEGLNSLIQAAKSKARGFRTLKNFKIITYLITGKLNFNTINPCYQPLPT